MEIKLTVYTLEELKKINQKAYEKEIETLKDALIQDNFNLYMCCNELENTINNILDCTIRWYDHYQYEYARIKYNNSVEDIDGYRCIGKLYRFFTEFKKDANFLSEWNRIFLYKLRYYVFDHNYILKHNYTFTEVIEKSLYDTFVHMYDMCYDVDDSQVIEDYSNNLIDSIRYTKDGTRIYL